MAAPGRLLATCLVGVLGACATTDYGVREAGARPDDQASPEASFWLQMDEAETGLKSSGKVIEDPVLTGFVRELSCDVAADYCDDLRPYIVEEPSFNASMAPNGMMLVHSGLLLRAGNASELAVVLGHEFVHFQENHTLERYGAMKNANRAGIAVSSVVIGAGGGALGDVAYLAALGSAFSFTREQETEADLRGLEALAAAGYNTGSAPIIWQNLLDELAASSKKDKRKRAVRQGFFDTHPAIEARIAELDLRSAAWEPVPVDPVAYRAMIRPHLADWLADEITHHDAGATLHLIGRLSQPGEDLGVLETARARVLALRGEAGDAAAAIAAYEAAITYEDAPAEAWRGLGELYRAEGRLAEAGTAFDTYLERAPDARDAALIRSIRDTLGEANS